LTSKLLRYDLSRPWRAALDLLLGISSPTRGGLPPGFMSLSKTSKSARDLRSAKNSGVCKAESFSATTVATNWFMLVRSSQRACHCFSHLLILLMASRGISTSVPNRSGADPRPSWNLTLMILPCQIDSVAPGVAQTEEFFCRQSFSSICACSKATAE